MSKKELLQHTIDAVNKKLGVGTVMRMSDGTVTAVSALSTGSYYLDNALGIGGYPRGRIVEIYGPESSGKTTLTLHAVAECQKAGGTAVFVDAEHALDIEYAQALGVDPDNLIISQPSSGEQALQIVEAFVEGGADMVVIDSVAALVPEAELKGEMGDTHVGLQARMMSQALRKLAGIVQKSNCIVIFINQIRSKIGVMFGSPETTTGGNALKFYASVRLDIRRIGTIKKGDDAIGNRVKVKVVKNKVAPPFKVVEFDILFGRGVNHVGEILDASVAKGVVKKGGAWYSYGDTKLGQGRDNSVEFLSENVELFETIKSALQS